MEVASVLMYLMLLFDLLFDPFSHAKVAHLLINMLEVTICSVFVSQDPL